MFVGTVYIYIYIVYKEVVGHPDAFCILLNSDILLSNTVFHLLYSKEVLDFR